jgi:hypothetical protein
MAGERFVENTSSRRIKLIALLFIELYLTQHKCPWPTPLNRRKGKWLTMVVMIVGSLMLIDDPIISSRKEEEEWREVGEDMGGLPHNSLNLIQKPGCFLGLIFFFTSCCSCSLSLLLDITYGRDVIGGKI